MYNVVARYITGKKSVTTRDLELMKHWLSGLTTLDIEIMKKEWLASATTQEKQQMDKDFRDIMKDFE